MKALLNFKETFFKVIELWITVENGCTLKLCYQKCGPKKEEGKGGWEPNCALNLILGPY